MKVSTVAPADQPVADKLRDLIGAKSLRYFDRKNERAAVEKFYTARELRPALDASRRNLTDSGKGVIARLKDAATDGLNPADYPVPDFAAAASPDPLAEAELKLTASMLDYARHAQSGRMHWSQVAADILYPEHPTRSGRGARQHLDREGRFRSARRLQPAAQALQGAEGQARRTARPGRWPGDPDRRRPGAGLQGRDQEADAVAPEDPRVPQLRAKLGIADHADSTQYDAKVAAAVRKFQQSVDLKATGVLDDRTVKAMNSPKRDRQIDIVLVNMERWRWLPRELGAPSLGNAYVMLNIPDFTLKVMQNGAQVWTTRVVTGKPGKHATPMLTETMKFITVNPTWNVPPSIIYNEYLPALQQDPTVLERMGLRLERNRDGSIHISQPPGEANALGRIRFNFPNKFLVYQHDTPDKHLFAKEERAFSHGCMRVQNPDQYAATLLNIVMPNERYSPEKDPQHVRPQRDRHQIPDADPGQHHLSDRVRGRRRQAADPQGHLRPRRHDDRVCSRTAATRTSRPWSPMPSRAMRVRRTRLPAGVNFASDNTSGPSFFERLFGGPSTATPPARSAAGRNSGSPANPDLPGAGFPNEINDLASPASSFTLTIIHPESGTGHFFATVRGLG